MVINSLLNRQLNPVPLPPFYVLPTFIETNEHGSNFYRLAFFSLSIDPLS